MVGVKVAAGSREEQEGSLMLKVTRLVSERGMQPGYLLTGRVQSGLQSGSITARGVCGGSLPTVPGGAPSSSCATSGTREGASVSLLHSRLLFLTGPLLWQGNARARARVWTRTTARTWAGARLQ